MKTRAVNDASRGGLRGWCLALGWLALTPQAISAGEPSRDGRVAAPLSGPDMEPALRDAAGGTAPAATTGGLAPAATTGGPAPAATTSTSFRDRLNAHLELHPFLILPAAVLSESDAAVGRGVWTQIAGGGSLTLRAHRALFATLTVLAYTEPDAREAWTPDFTYAFGYDDYHPFTFFLVHTNYTGNQFPWQVRAARAWENARQGLTTAGWRFQWPERWRDWLELSPAWWAGGSLAVHYAWQYGRIDGTTGQHLAMASAGLTMTFREQFFAEVRAYLYPIPGQQQPWDPDFTYSIGWLDWRPWHVSLRWNNYTGNRWPGHTLEGNGGLFRGALVVDLRAGF